MASSKYVIYRDIFIAIIKNNDRSYVAFAYGFENLKSSNFETEEYALTAIKISIDNYINECSVKKIIYKRPTPPDCRFLDSSRERRDVCGVTKEECISISDSFFVKESNFSLSALFSKVLVYRKDGSFFVDFSKFLRESKFVDANKHVVFAPLTNKIYDICYKLNHLYGVFQIYVDSNGLLIVEYDREKIEYGRVYELEYEVYNESRGRGYLVIHRDGLFDNCEFKGFHNLLVDYQYRSNSVIFEDYQTLSKLLPDSDCNIRDGKYKLVKYQLAFLLRQSIETDLDRKLIDRFLKLSNSTFFYFLSHYVFKYTEFNNYTYEFLNLDKYKAYSKPVSFIEDAKIYKKNCQYEVLKDIVLQGCQNDDEFEILKLHLAGLNSISVNEKDHFVAFNVEAAKAAWEYVGKMSEKNQILSFIAIKKIDGMNDAEVYDKIKDMRNFLKIRELLGIKSKNGLLKHNDKFVKRIIVEHVFKLADEHHIPKPKLRAKRSSV